MLKVDWRALTTAPVKALLARTVSKVARTGRFSRSASRPPWKRNKIPTRMEAAAWVR